MSMHTPEEWARHAVNNMAQAQNTQSQAHRQNVRSKSAHGGTVHNNLNMYQELAQSMKQKVQNSYKVIEMLQRRAASIEKTLDQTALSLGSLEKALMDKDPLLQLCQWRLEQREKRPLREQVRDPVETALEDEKAVLIDTQRKLKEAIRKTKATIHDLRQSLHDCQLDIEHKMQALSVDEQCLRSTETSMHRVVERTPPSTSSTPRSPNSMKQSRHQVALHESSRNEADRLRDAEKMNRAFASHEEHARALREESARLERQCGQMAAEARARMERKLQERIQETQHMRRCLESELHETQAKINDTKNTMSETKHQIQALDEPKDMTANCASMRQMRASKEGITDPVSTTLQGHRMVILKHQKELTSHHQFEKTNLQDLQQRRTQLKDDLRDKTTSLHIDMNVLTHEVVRLNGQTWTGVSRSKAAYMGQVDRGWVPGAVAVRQRPRSALR
mmetsp:Transcript_147852/g.474632  ORF Transcript_147852/g.474632 Transcript_147852/m.474632 type:complete len:449 (-) Transcript_147852:181-1527(-)